MIKARRQTDKDPLLPVAQQLANDSISLDQRSNNTGLNSGN